MGQLLGAFKGYRSYITLGLAFIVGGLLATNVITQEQANSLQALLLPLGLIFIRAAK